MRDHEYREDGRPEDLLQELGYETQDIQYGKFAVYGAYFFGFLFLCVISGFAIMYFMSPTKLVGGRTADYEPKVKAPLSAPLLQSNITARTDIMSLRRKETAAMTTPMIIDQARGIYRIPVKDAIDIIAQRGLPATLPMPTGAPVTANTDLSNLNRGGSATTTPANGGTGG
jgi:hypothetical protein